MNFLKTLRTPQLASNFKSTRTFSTLAKKLSPGITVDRKKLFINGEYVDSLSGKTLPTIDPRDESVICDVALASEEDVDRAVKAARKAFDEGPWKKESGFQRAKLLLRIADLIERDMDTLARLETLDNGKPLGLSNLDLHFVLEYFRYMAGWCDKIQGKTLPCNNVLGRYRSYTVHEPLGVVSAITPWNFPLLMWTWQVAAALATGNTIVCKVSELTPLTAYYMGGILQEAGVPEGVVNTVAGYGEIAGRHLAQSPQINKVSFTGGTITGRDIMKSAAMNLTPVTLELGGKSPSIIFEDADIDNAVGQHQVGLFLNCGQCCCASSRIYVHEKVYDEFVEKTIEETRKRKVGDGFAEGIDQGPTCNRTQFDKVLSYVAQGKESKAELLLGGHQIGDTGLYHEATIFGNVPDDTSIAQEEIFGPVMQIMKFKGTDEVIQRSNNSGYGLAAGVFSNNINTINKAVRELQAGTVWVNCYDVFDASLPFGGYKNSGFGRVKSEYTLDAFTQVKCVTTKLEDDNGPY